MSKFRRMLVNNKGFTLIELLVVIAVLGILAAIAIPRLTGVTDKAKISEGETKLATAKNAAYMYNTEEGSWPKVGNYSGVEELDAYVDNINSLIPESISGGETGWAFSDNNTADSTSTLRIDYYASDGNPNLYLELDVGSGEIDEYTPGG